MPPHEREGRRPHISKDRRRLKGCPFCASREVEVMEFDDPRGHQLAVHCLRCLCEGPSSRSERSAVSLWNRRPGEPGEPE